MNEEHKKISYFQSIINHNKFGLLWISVGISIFIFIGHRHFYFPLVFFLWLLIGIGFYSVRRWQAKAILIAPLVSVLICFVINLLFNTYNWRQADIALNEFIVSASEGADSPKIHAHGNIYDKFKKDASINYKVEYQDNFFGSYEWIVRFENNSAYFLSFVPSRSGEWRNVGIEHISP